MEVQRFMLCLALRQTTQGGFDATRVAVHSFYSKDGQFPLQFHMPFYMLIRRPDRGAEKAVTLRFNLIDQDGNPTGDPRNIKAIGSFPTGHMFINLRGTIEFSFPGIGDYRLDITADEETIPFLYQYDIEITESPEWAPSAAD
jgi:hypothetical protein